MIRFVDAHPEQMSSDCTSTYIIEFEKPMTLKQFVNIVFEERPNEWGYFNVHNQLSDDYLDYPYERGKLSRKIPVKFLDRKIENVWANGGWSSMDYYIRLEE